MSRKRLNAAILLLFLVIGSARADVIVTPAFCRRAVAASISDPERDRAFHRVIAENPREDGVRLVYSDWLEENGQPEVADFIREQVRFEQLLLHPPPRTNEEVLGRLLVEDPISVLTELDRNAFRRGRRTFPVLEEALILHRPVTSAQREYVRALVRSLARQRELMRQIQDIWVPHDPGTAQPGRVLRFRRGFLSEIHLPAAEGTDEALRGFFQANPGLDFVVLRTPAQRQHDPDYSQDCREGFLALNREMGNGVPVPPGFSTRSYGDFVRLTIERSSAMVYLRVQSGLPHAGVVFGVFDAGGTLHTIVRTNAQGVATIAPSNLPAGYRVRLIGYRDHT